jgi:hypothetical protein
MMKTKAIAEALRGSVVACDPRSQTAKRQVQKKRTAMDFPVHSFQSLLKDPGNYCQKSSPSKTARNECDF